MVHPGSVCGKITFKLSNFQGWLHMVHPGSVWNDNFQTFKFLRLAPYGPPWPCLGEIIFKLSNFQTFKLLRLAPTGPPWLCVWKDNF